MKKNIAQYLFSVLILLLSISTAYSNTVEPHSPVAVETESQVLRFIVYHQGTFEEVMNSDNAALRNFLAIYDLHVANSFEINEENKGFTLESNNLDLSFEEVARALSLIDAVLMVEVAQPNMEESL